MMGREPAAGRGAQEDGAPGSPGNPQRVWGDFGGTSFLLCPPLAAAWGLLGHWDWLQVLCPRAVLVWGGKWGYFLPL